MAQLDTKATSSAPEVLEGFDAVVGYNKGSIISLDGKSHSVGWQNGSADADVSDVATPVNADNLNRMHFAIVALRDALIKRDTVVDGKFTFEINGDTITFDEDHPIYDVIKSVADSIVGNTNSTNTSTVTTDLHGLRNYLMGLDYEKVNTTCSFLTSIKQVDGKIVSAVEKELTVKGAGDASNLDISEIVSGESRRVNISNSDEVWARRNLADALIESGSTYTENTEVSGTNPKVTVDRAANVKAITNTHASSEDTVGFTIGDKTFTKQITRVGEAAQSDDTLLGLVNNKYATKTVGGITGSNRAPVKMEFATVNELLVELLGITDRVAPNGFSISAPDSVDVPIGNSSVNVRTVTVQCTISTGTDTSAVFDYYLSNNSVFSSTPSAQGATCDYSIGHQLGIGTSVDSVTIYAKCIYKGDTTLTFTDTHTVNVKRPVESAVAPVGTAPSSMDWSSKGNIHKSSMSVGKTVTFNLNGGVAAFKYPKYWGELSSILDQNGFENISAFDRYTVDNDRYFAYVLSTPAYNEMTYTFKL